MYLAKIAPDITIKKACDHMDQKTSKDKRAKR